MTLDKPILQGLDSSSTTAAHPTGYHVTAANGTEFTYVLTDASTLAAAAGYPAHWMVGTTNAEVTSDISDTATRGAAFAGVFCCAISAADACYM